MLRRLNNRPNFPGGWGGVPNLPGGGFGGGLLGGGILGSIAHPRMLGMGKGSSASSSTNGSNFGAFGTHASDTAKAVKATSTPDPLTQPYKPLSKQPYGLG